MHHLSSLIEQLGKPEQSVIVANGHAVWMVWHGKLSDTVGRTLSDFGGWPLAQEKEQALWFFSEKDVLKGFARLYTWSRINPLALFAQVFPANLLVSNDFSLSIAVNSSLVTQHVDVPKTFEILIAPQIGDELRGFPGLAFVDPQRGNLPPGKWTQMEVDINFEYSTALSWFLFIKPLGNPLDRSFANGWRAYSSQLKKIFDQLKIPYLYTEDLFLILHCTAYQSLQAVCLELMQLLEGKNSPEGSVPWPCVMLVTEKAHLHFGKHLPEKIPVTWDSLEANYIHIPLKIIYHLGRTFMPLGTLSAVKGGNKITDFVKMGHRKNVADNDVGSLKIFLPHHVAQGTHPPCFYCGLRSHHAGDCPSRLLLNPNLSLADGLAELDFERIRHALAEIDQQWSADPLVILKDGLQGTGDISLIIASWFENNITCQIRMMRIMWRSKGRDWPLGLRKLAPQEEDNAWSALHRFRNGDLDRAVEKVLVFARESPRHFKAKTLLGFVSMEKGQYKNALKYWKEAFDLSLTPMHQSYHLFLQARLHEVTLEYEKAIALYRQAFKISPGMHEARYRHAVCLVKIGFSEQALGIFLEIIEENPYIFNMILIDPELDRGHLYLMAGLWSPWVKMQKIAKTSLKELDSVTELVEKWFTQSHPAYEPFRSQIKTLLGHEGKKNFVHLVRLVNGCASLNRDIQKRVEKDIKKFHSTCKNMYAELGKIQLEASWFPFAKFLRGFNKNFNKCIRGLNEIGRLNLTHPESFKKAHVCMQETSDSLDHLHNHLKSLCLIRDSVLFILLIWKNFLWIELAALGGALLIMPIVTMWGIKTGQGWGYALSEQKWMVQKILLMVISIFALGSAALWTTLRFEKKKDLFLRKHKK